jgi:hypothetical protein
MASLPPIVTSCIEQLLAASPAAMARAVDHASRVLHEESRQAPANTRQALTAAAQDLAQQRSQLCASIGGALRKAISSPAGAGGGVRLNPSSLTLVDDTEVTQSIESSRLGMQVESLVEKPLAELDRFMSTALRLDGIQRDENPLRPGVFAQAVRQAMNDCDPQPGQPALWMRHMAQPLAGDLEQVYKACSKQMERAGVRPAEYRVVTGPSPLTPRSSAPAPLQPQGHGPGAQHGLANGPSSGPSSGVVPMRSHEAPRASMAAWLELATQAIGGTALREFLFGGSTVQAQQPLAPSYYRHIEEELAALEARWDEAPPDPGQARAYQHLPVVDRPARPVGTDTSLSRETWGTFAAPRQRSLVRTRLRKEAQRVGQVMGIDLVHQLVDQVARDPRLLAPVREAMVALEPSLARLAMHAPRFFGEQQNPARQLLEAVAQRSFKYNDEFSTEFRDFFAGVTQRFNSLNDVEELADSSPFDGVLQQFQRDWSVQDEHEERERQRVIESVRFAERRQEEADRIAWELSQRTDLDGAPAAVQDFLYGTWSLVIAHARLQGRDGDMDPGGYIRVIADLLWSVKRDLTLRDPARAFELIPRLIPILRSGLDLLGHPPAETASFFNALERLHRPVMKLRAKHRRQATPIESAAAPLDDDLKPAPAQKPEPHEEFWMREGELRACGFEDTVPSEHVPLHAQPQPQPHAPAAIPVTRVAGPALPAPQADALIAELAEGCWVDLFSKQRWRRARLTWASTKRTLFMFVSHGGQPHSMTRRTLQRLVVNRLLRPLETHAVVEHALEMLVTENREPLAA